MVIKEWMGIETDAEIAVKVIDALNSHRSFVDKSVSRTIYRVAIELITNIKNHAYPDTCRKHEAQSWIVRLVERESEVISLVVEDNGISIPQSILNKLYSSEEQILFRGNALAHDALLIDQAVNQKKIGDSLPERGKGLKSIVKLVELKKLKSFHIQSRSGTFHYYGGPKPTLEFRESPFIGTSVEVAFALTGPTK